MYLYILKVQVYKSRNALLTPVLLSSIHLLWSNDIRPRDVNTIGSRMVMERRMRGWLIQHFQFWDLETLDFWHFWLI